MANYKQILALDPSGNFKEGKGTTGFCLLNTRTKTVTTWDIKAADYKSTEAYWTAITNCVADMQQHNKSIVVVIEDYMLYESKAQNQINSLLETPRLIGILQWYCFNNGIPYYLEFASVVKKRWTNKILAYKGYITVTPSGLTTLHGEKISRHCVDAVRHAVNYNTFINQKKK